MKKLSLFRQHAPWFLALSSIVSVDATVTGTLPPAAATWVHIADTSTVALGSGAALPPPGPVVAGVKYVNFDPPVVSQFDQSVAFKGWLDPILGVTAATDEGVWSTGPRLRVASTTHVPTLVLREGDPVPGSSGATFGASGLTVQNLQQAFWDWTVCATDTSLGKIAVANNDLLYNLGESGSGTFTDLRPPVAAGFQVAGHLPGWKRINPTKSGVDRMVSPTPLTPPSPPVSVGRDTGGLGLSCAGVPYKPNQPARVASPSTSEAGWVAAYARDNWTSPNHIQLRNPTLGAVGVVVRELDPSPPVPGLAWTTPRFGTIHNQLMANSDSLTAGSELVTWQMATMRDTSLGTVVNKTSLWCKCLLNYSCLAYQTGPAPDLPALYTISSFYALHAVPDFSTAGDHWIFWGAMISPGNKVAIYRTHVAAGVAGASDLIASTVTGTTPVNLLVGGTQNITQMDRFFSVNCQAAVIFKAACATAPPGKKHILVTAQAMGGHLRQVRAQSGVATAGVPIPSLSTSLPATIFELAKPEQGSYSRGQAVGTQWFSAKILYAGGQGIYFAGL